MNDTAASRLRRKLAERDKKIDGLKRRVAALESALATAHFDAKRTPIEVRKDRELELPPEGHPLHKLGARLTELLDEDQWTACERLLLEGWAHDAIDRKTGANWRDDSSLQVWFPYTHEELARLRETLQGIADADWRRWEELATPDEFVRWAKSRAAHALRPNT